MIDHRWALDAEICDESKGLPVAKVTKVVKREPGRDQEIEALPTVNFSRLDAVLIIVGEPADEDEAKDKKPPAKGK